MRKFITKTIFLTIVIGLLFFAHTGCKKSDSANEFILNVSVADGVNGAPPTGTFGYSNNEQVTYQYTLKDRYLNLKVELDGTEVAATGTITMSESHVLVVTADPLPGDFLLSVALSEGVTGTPEQGNFNYNQGDTLDYSYSLEDGYTNMRVQLDGVDVPDSGTIVFDQAHTLFVFADVFFEIRGTWTMREAYEDESGFTVTLTFSGDAESGTVVDSDGGTGTYTVVGPVVNFTIEYPDVTYEYSGTFTDENNMGGISSRITSSGTFAGSWVATNDAAAAATFSLFSNGNVGKAKN